VSGGATPGGTGRGTNQGTNHGTGRGGSEGPGTVTLPSVREATATLGASLLSLVAGYLVLFLSELGTWLGWLLLAGGVVLFGGGVRAGVALQRHYDEGGRVAGSSRLLVWVIGTVAGAGALGAVLLGGAHVLSATE
jgi:hypothetical protein